MQPGKINILSTGALPAYLAEEAEANDLEIDIIPFIKTEAIQSIEVQQEIEQALLLSATVIFTSRNAVEAVVAAEPDELKPDWGIYCIGNKTKELVAEYFGEENIYGSADDAQSLAELILEENLSGEVIFFCGDQRRDELPDTLREHAIEVNEIMVYQTVPVPRKASNNYDGILFFSPSGVDSFFKLNRIEKKTILFAIGNTTSNAIKKYSENKVIISKAPDKEQMIREVVNYFS